MSQLRPLTPAEKDEALALIGRVLGAIDPTRTFRDDYYREVLERIAESLQAFGVIEVAPYPVLQQVEVTAKEEASRVYRPPAA